MRPRLLTALVVVGFAVACVARAPLPESANAAARAQPGKIPPTGAIKHVRDNLFVIPGQGGNTVVFVTQAGVVLVDTKLANNGESIMKQVRTVTDKPVTMIINTHAHRDHNGSNDYFKATRSSVEVVTHENAKRRLTEDAQSNPATIADKTYGDRLTIGGANDRIELYYFGAGHTDGDAFVVFPSVRAMAAGDMFALKSSPLIDSTMGGSMIALPDTLEKASQRIANVDTVIEGHGDINTWVGFREYVQFNRALVDRATTGMGKRTAEQIVADVGSQFPAFTKDEPLPGIEYVGIPRSRAVTNVNLAFTELKKR